MSATAWLYEILYQILVNVYGHEYKQMLNNKFWCYDLPEAKDATEE